MVQAPTEAGERSRSALYRMDCAITFALLAYALPFSAIDLSFLLGGGLLLAAIGLGIRLRISRREPPRSARVPEVERVGVEPERLKVEA